MLIINQCVVFLCPDSLHAFTHRQFVVKSFDLDDQAVFPGRQFVLQLGHFGLVGRLCKVMAEDVDQQVEQDDTEIEGRVN